MSVAIRKARRQKSLFSFKLILLIAAIIYMGILFIDQEISISLLARQERELLRKIEQLEQSNENLRAEIDKYKSPDYVERLAREKLGLVKEGEIPYVIDRVGLTSKRP